MTHRSSGQRGTQPSGCHWRKLLVTRGVVRCGRFCETQAVSWYASAGVPDVLMLFIVENCESVGGCFVGDRRADRLVTTGEFGNNPAVMVSF